MKSGLIDIEVHLHHQTDKAVLVSIDGDSDKAEWVPKSRCEIEEISQNSVVQVITLEEELAIEKGLV